MEGRISGGERKNREMTREGRGEERRGEERRGEERRSTESRGKRRPTHILYTQKTQKQIHYTIKPPSFSRRPRFPSFNSSIIKNE